MGRTSNLNQMRNINNNQMRCDRARGFSGNGNDNRRGGHSQGNSSNSGGHSHEYIDLNVYIYIPFSSFTLCFVVLNV